ncbi:MAG: translocation/assembly module TamB domain-containing protein [Bryobacteraceae bacterium]|nr:translocation/assembly module TamB domain-containing protein [Bryobacteraceae bacterium]
MKRRTRILLIAAGALAGLLLVAAIAVTLLLRSQWFEDKVRERIVAEVEKTTGGAASIGAFRFDWTTLRAGVTDFVLRGSEPADHDPLFRADSIEVGLKLVSVMRRDVDIELLRIEKPFVSIEEDEHGRTNIPAPKVRREGDLIEPLIRLAIGRIEIVSGVARYNSKAVPLEVSGEDLNLEAFYEPAGQRYRGSLAVRQVRVAAPERAPVAFDAEAEWALATQRFDLPRARLRLAKSTAEVSGALTNFRAPRALFDVKAQLAMEEIVEPAKLPLLPEGEARFDGTVSYSEGNYSASGVATAGGLAMREGRVFIGGIAASAAVDITPGTINLTDVAVAALGGRFSGTAAIRDLDRFTAAGNVRDFRVRQLARTARAPEVPWDGLVSGPIEVQGRIKGPGAPGVVAKGRMAIQPAPEGTPLQGAVAVSYNQRGDVVVFGPSHLELPATTIDFAGRLDERLEVELATTNPNELLPALTMFGEEEVPESLPVELAGGSLARFKGAVSGILGEPHIDGRLTTGPFGFQRGVFDYFDSAVALDSRLLRLTDITLRQNEAVLKGHGHLGLENWRVADASAIGAEVTLTSFSVAGLLKELGRDLPVTGTLSGAAKLAGTKAAPNLLALVRVNNPAAYGERLDFVEAEARYADRKFEIASVRAQAGAARIGLRGHYIHSPEDWKTGQLQFETSGRAVRLAQWKAVREARAGMDADVEWQFTGAGQTAGGDPRLTLLGGDLFLNNVTLEGRRLGMAHLTATTRGNLLLVSGTAGLIDASLTLAAEWSLERASFGLGSIRFAGLTLGGLRDVGLLGSREKEVAHGVFDGDLAFSGPVLRPDTWQGMARITRMEVTPEFEGIAPKKRDLTLRNSGPLLFAIDRQGISIEAARLVSEDTDLEASGQLSFVQKNPWNLQIAGSMDLGVLSVLNTDLLAEGKSVVDLALRGSLLEPQVNGRIQFEDAAFSLEDVPNGLERARGTILFDRNRATIEEFSSQTGGGNLSVGGFVGFGQEFVYRLQAKADQVRVRYPEGVSTVLNARLEFTGTSARSLLSGEVTVERASFHPSTDIGSLLSQTARPDQPTAITNPFLRGMQFDVRIRTSGSGVFQTSLTRDIELEADFRLGGGPARPVLLGRVDINEGEILFFGNRYTIVQGEITFFNPAKIEPVVAMDLETRVRGYTVIINFSGPLNKLNFSYRSDPPLQSAEILALLTVGRAPDTLRSTVPQSSSAQNVFQAGGNSLLGQALAAPVSSRLQRLFGVSRIKIDPQLTGVDNTPETLVTVEQQLSREITLTYVTNLTRTQQQIVRIEWKFSKDWSVFAVRDSNGIFGVDFMYQRRF